MELTVTHTLDWRAEAIAEALGAEALRGNGADALLREIRLRHGGWVTLTLWGGAGRSAGATRPERGSASPCCNSWRTGCPASPAG